MLSNASKPVTDRNSQIDRFVSQHISGPYERQIVAADASFRRYERIIHAAGTHIIMDAPPEHEDTSPFIQVAKSLHILGLRAPQIHAADEAHGFLLLEDFGSDSFTRFLQLNQEHEATCYRAAIDVAVMLYHQPDPFRLPAYDRAVYQRELGILGEWFLPTRFNDKHQLQDNSDGFMEIWTRLLNEHSLDCQTPVLRDYHADNLMWQPERHDVDRVCLLDFQDALMGDGAYDLVSLLEDARRDVPPALADELIRYYCTRTAQDEAAFRLRYHLLGAQRNCKIIGIFNRLNQRDGKPHYLAYLPRVWAHLRHDLTHPALAPLAAWFKRHELLD